MITQRLVTHMSVKAVFIENSRVNLYNNSQKLRAKQLNKQFKTNQNIFLIISWVKSVI